MIIAPLLLTVFLSAGPEPKTPPDLPTRAKTFVTQLAHQEWSKASKDFDEAMRKALPGDKLKDTWQELIAQVGAFKKEKATRKEHKGKYDIVYVTCEFAKSTLDVKVVFTADGKIGGMFFVPTRKAGSDYQAPAYVHRDTFHDVDVTVGKGEWHLPGTLSLPVGDRRWPALILVHGSGPEDRDETIGPNLPFRDLAWGLASRGIAVLRYDKRTKVYPEKVLATGNFTVKDETLDDVRAAADLLRGRKDIDPQRIFVAGHSLGGMLLPRIAADDPALAGFISLAGSTRPLTESMIEQVDYILAVDPSMPADGKESLEKLKKHAEELKALDLSHEKVSRVILGAPISYWRDLRAYSVAEAARKITRPILILQGERDYQVTMHDFATWKTALALRKNATFKSYPALNHLFIEGKGKSRPEEYDHPGHVAAEVIDDIAQWIGKVRPRSSRTIH